MIRQAIAGRDAVSIDVDSPFLGKRFYPVDGLRGLALVLMGLDHSAFFSQVGLTAEHYIQHPTNLEAWYHWLTGLVTNIATPAFWFVSGISILFFESGQRRNGASQWKIGRFFLIRAGVILLLDQTLIALMWGRSFNVLSALAISMIFTNMIRLLPLPLITATGVLLLGGFEAIWRAFPVDITAPDAFFQAMWLTWSDQIQPNVAFPVLGWIGLMILGYAAGRWIQSGRLRTAREWALAGTTLLAMWLVLRAAGGYGNLLPDPVEPAGMWFWIMYKGPPSLTYQIFNLGIALLIGAFFILIQDRLQRPPFCWLILAGQSSLFFYVAHIIVYKPLSIMGQTYLTLPGILRAGVIWLIGLAILIPLSSAYRRIKKRYPSSVLRYF